MDNDGLTALMFTKLKGNTAAYKLLHEATARSSDRFSGVKSGFNIQPTVRFAPPVLDLEHS